MVSFYKFLVIEKVDEEEKEKLNKKDEIYEEPQQIFDPLKEPILFEIEEKIKGEITKDNEFKRLEVKGEGFITVLNPSKCKSFLLLNCKEKVKFTTSKINKNLLNEKNIIQAEVIFIFYIQNKEEGFTANIKTCVFKYSIKLAEEHIPFNFNCFTSSSGNVNIVNFNIEFNDQSKFRSPYNISFEIPLSVKNSKINSQNSNYESKSDRLIWKIEEFSDSVQPSIEIKTTENPSNLFPINVYLKTSYSILGVDIKAFDENKDALLLNFKESCESQNFLVTFE